MIRNLLKCNIIGLIIAYFDPFMGLSFFIGTLWGGINLVLIQQLLQNFLGSRNWSKILLFLGIKFPVLYCIGYELLLHLDPTGLLIGFSTLLMMITFKGLTVKTACLAIPIASSELPEIPNIFTLIDEYGNNALTAFLHDWENIIFSIIVAIMISLTFYFGLRNKKQIPTGLQNFLEWSVGHLRNFILEILGPTGEKYVPFLGTLFIYILSMNLMVLIPFMKAPSSSLNITIALAICVFCLVQYLNIRNWGLMGFLYHMAGSPKNFVEWALVPIMFPIEILTQFTRPITLSLRLFGNIFGEDILIGAFALFGVLILSTYQYVPIGLPLQIPFLFLALLTSAMQALVFTLLSTIYILLSMPHTEESTSD